MNRISPALAAFIALATPFSAGIPPLDTGRRRDPVRDLLVPAAPRDEPTHHFSRRGGDNGLMDLMRPNPYRASHEIVTDTDRARTRAESVAKSEAKRARRIARSR